MTIRKRPTVSLFFSVSLLMLALPIRAEEISFKALGSEIRLKVLDQFKQRQKDDALRITDLTELCRSFGLEGRSYDEVNEIMKDAGQKFDLQPLDVSKKGGNEVFGAFTLERANFYSSAFYINFELSKSKKRKEVSKVVFCHVLVNSL
jgi:hypothetical protein